MRPLLSHTLLPPLAPCRGLRAVHGVESRSEIACGEARLDQARLDQARLDQARLDQHQQTASTRTALGMWRRHQSAAQKTRQMLKRHPREHRKPIRRREKKEKKEKTA
eukprot:1683817-Rhodomonas_salina.2